MDSLHHFSVTMVMVVMLIVSILFVRLSVCFVSSISDVTETRKPTGGKLTKTSVPSTVFLLPGGVGREGHQAPFSRVLPGGGGGPVSLDHGRTTKKVTFPHKSLVSSTKRHVLKCTLFSQCIW